MMMSPQVEAFVRTWHEVFEKDQPERMRSLVHDDIEFYSPAIFRPKQGKKTVLELLMLVYAIFENYSVTDTWVREREVLFEFEVEVGKYTLQGIDRFTLDDDGKVTHMKVWLRPLSAVKELARRVSTAGLEEYLAQRGPLERLGIRARVRAARLFSGVQEGLR